jgi:hypothetical protein
MRPHKLGIEQCRVTPQIRRRYGAKSALDYLLGEKLLAFSEEAQHRAEFAQELPRFLAAIGKVFNPYELSGYIASQRPPTRQALPELVVSALKPSGGNEAGSAAHRFLF